MSTKLRQDKSKQANEKDSITLLQRLCCFSANKQARLSKIVPINTEPKQETKNIDNQPSLQKDFSVFGKQKRFPTIRIERLTNPIDVSQISDLSNNDFEIIKTTQSTPESIGKHNFKLPLTRLDSNLNAIPQYEDNWEIQPTVTHINYKESQTKKQQFKDKQNNQIFQQLSSKILQQFQRVVLRKSTFHQIFCRKSENKLNLRRQKI
ncbi:UNKNOWN [Stylonychia lemnae]|uniref:Uncharacterized protein n=1 Tax=Stylonychia lemnae TaxID=5949 RepID=A0A077ZW63_STYLE|nr:UNKNOWN [Stylonychia lemnae]|eukprot:CDW72691.1 UNKNOWN [Stylonychia lemnae]